MADQVKAVPDGYHTITPSIVVTNGSEALEFYKKAFGAEELCRMASPDGQKIMHAELRIGNSIFFVSDEFPEMNMRAPVSLGGSSAGFHIYIEDVDTAYDRALRAGATALNPPEDAFWGDRYGKVTDPYGHVWGLATHVKDVTPEEMARAAEEWMQNNASADRAKPAEA